MERFYGYIAYGDTDIIFISPDYVELTLHKILFSCGMNWIRI